MTELSHTGNAVRLGYPINNDLNPFYTMINQMDCAVFNKGAADTAAMFAVKIGMIVLEVVCEVLTAEGGAATIDVGKTGGDVDGWLDGVDINATGWTFSGTTKTMSTTSANVVAGSTTQLLGLIGADRITADDTIDALFNTAATAVVKFNLYAVILDLKLAGIPR